MKILTNKPLLVFILFLSVFLLFSNGKVTSSMDVDVIRYAQNLLDTGSIGSEAKLSNGTVYSHKTHLFYPLEGIGVILPVVIMSYISDILNIDSTFLIFATGSVFFALTLMFMYKIFNLYLSEKRSLLFCSMLGIATPVFVMSKMLFPEPFVMFSISGSLYFYFDYIKNRSVISLFLTGLFTGMILLIRPDAPIFYLLISILVLIRIFNTEKRSKNNVLFFSGLAIFTLVFFIYNFIRFDSILETGYTVNKYNRDEVKRSLNNDISSLPEQISLKLEEAKIHVAKDKNSSESQRLIKEYYSLDRSLKDKQDYLEKIESSEKFRINDVLATKGNEGFGKLIKDYFYGLYLILIFPNRAVFFLSPILIFVFLGIKDFFRDHKLETLFLSLAFFAYLSLYALRAPYGYSGTAAWGIRYMLPMFLILSIFFIGLNRYFDKEHPKYKLFRYTFFSLLVISGVFQLIGSSINYQHVQMPLENVITQVYGKENISMSRIQLMTEANSSLLINNFQILTGKPPQVIKKHLNSEILNGIKVQYAENSGPNDWFFYDLLFSDSKQLTSGLNSPSNYKILFFLLIISLFSSFILLLKKQKI